MPTKHSDSCMYDENPLQNPELDFTELDNGDHAGLQMQVPNSGFCACPLSLRELSMISTAFSFKLSTVLRLKKLGFWHCPKSSLVGTCLSICVCGWHACGVVTVVCCMLVICVEGSLAKSALIQTCTRMPCFSLCATTVMPLCNNCNACSSSLLSCMQHACLSKLG